MEELIQTTDRNHFVSQNIINNFIDNQYYIYDKEDKIKYPNSKNKKLITSKNIFFGWNIYTDILEKNIMANKVENKGAKVIYKIISNFKDKLSLLDKRCLVNYIILLILINPKNFEISQKLNDINREIIWQDGLDQLTKLKKIDIEKLRNDFMLGSELTYEKHVLPYLKYLDKNLFDDIGFKILVNDTNIDFILSDNPVLKINYFLQNAILKHNFFINGDIACLDAKGLQYFLPISPRLIVCLYDKDCYEINNGFLLNEKFVNCFNGLQIKNCSNEYIYNDITVNHDNYNNYICDLNFVKLKPHCSNIGILKNSIINNMVPLRKGFSLNSVNKPLEEYIKLL